MKFETTFEGYKEALQYLIEQGVDVDKECSWDSFKIITLANDIWEKSK